MKSKETGEIEIAITKYIKYLDSLSDYLPIVERKFVTKQHIEGLVNKILNDYHIKEVQHG